MLIHSENGPKDHINMPLTVGALVRAQIKLSNLTALARLMNFMPLEQAANRRILT